MRKSRVGAAQGRPAEYMDFVPYAKGACRRGSGMACRVYGFRTICERRVSARHRDGLPELLRGPRNASRPWDLVFLSRPV